MTTKQSLLPLSDPSRPYFTHRFSLLAVYALALSVNLGVALVSISKLLVLIAICVKVLSLIAQKRWQVTRSGCWTFSAIGLALAWMSLSWFWSEALPAERWQSLGRQARLWVLPAVFYLLETKQDALKAMYLLILGQMFVVMSSWLLWLGVPLPWAMSTYPNEFGIVFTSSLEQPVMGTFMLVLIWFLRHEIPQPWRNRVVAASVVLTTLNVFFVMSGRTGYLVMLLAISLAVFWQLPRLVSKKWRLLAVISPLLIAISLALVSTKFQTRMLEIKRDVLAYSQEGRFNSSQGQRLDYWIASIKATADKPLLGSGVGSWRGSYFQHGGVDNINFTTNPHQQYLLWSVESGLIGLLLLLAIFVAAYRDSKLLEGHTQQALRATLAITFLMGLMNCPFFGAGMGEFIFLMTAALLATKQR